MPKSSLRPSPTRRTPTLTWRSASRPSRRTGWCSGKRATTMTHILPLVRKNFIATVCPYACIVSLAKSITKVKAIRIKKRESEKLWNSSLGIKNEKLEFRFYYGAGREASVTSSSKGKGGARAGHLRYFLIFSLMKNDFLAFLYKVNNLLCTSPLLKAHY